MSPGATMERVYLELKARIVAGAYPPGTRLDPEHLASTLTSSSMPIREALNRLTGERLVDSWHQEGFRLPILSEADLHDLYSWTRALLSLALRSTPPKPVAAVGPMPETDVDDYSARIARLFHSIALLSENRELHHSMVNLVERTQLIRAVEVRVDPVANYAVTLMEEDFQAASWSDLRSKISQFHRRRLAWAGRVVVELRPRSQTL